MEEIIKCYRCGKKPKVKIIHSHFFRIKCDCGVAQEALFNVLENSVRDWNKFQHNFVAKLPPLQNVDASLNAAVENIQNKERDLMESRKMNKPLSVEEVCEYIKIGTNQFYKHHKKMKSFKIDGRIFVLGKDAIEWRRQNPPRSKRNVELLKDILKY